MARSFAERFRMAAAFGTPAPHVIVRLPVFAGQTVAFADFSVPAAVETLSI